MRTKSSYISAGRSGLEKAAKFIQTIQDNGWEAKVKEDEIGMVHVFARRGEDEVIEIWWQPGNGAITAANPPRYVLAGHEQKLQNVSACVSIALRAPDTERLAKQVQKQTRRINRRNTTVGALVSDDLASAVAPTGEALRIARSAIAPVLAGDDSAVVRALRGTTISWLNSQSGLLESAYVAKVNGITRNGRDIVNFVDKKETGFRAVYLDAIVSIA